jgi:Uma2 family endonuclease
MNAVTRLKLSNEAFTQWCAARSERYELVDGEPHMMVRVTDDHDKIAANWMAILFRQLDRKVFDVKTGEFAVATEPRTFRLPDVTVKRRGGPGKKLETSEPLFVIEVLSGSSVFRDFSEKAQEYLAMPTLVAYAICAQDTPTVWLYERSADGWPAKPAELTMADGAVHIAALGIAAAFDDIFFDVELRSD